VGVELVGVGDGGMCECELELGCELMTLVLDAVVNVVVG
jgi:hypothetical protein